jgi:hypothetical protein
VFEGREYASYVKLCREFRPLRTFEYGDWFVNADRFPGRAFVSMGIDMAEGAVWLPRLDQWLAMLEDADVIGTCCDGDREAGYLYQGDHKSAGTKRGEGPTREEACARLWMAVTGRVLTA